MTFKDIADKINTPAYVFSSAEFKERAQKTREILGPTVKICYSIKANPFLLSMLPSEFSAVEVCSPGELEICMSLGVDPSMVIYSGLNKGREDIAAALDYGAAVLTAESMLHLEMINEAAAERNIKAKVLVRASANSQFGIDRKSLPQILADASAKYPAIEFVGLHFFTGTQKHKSKEIIKELGFLERYIGELREASGLELPRIEYGTGLPAHMFKDAEIGAYEDALSAELDMLREIAPQLRQLAEHAELTIEMGRFFAASCGHYYTKVVDAKRNDDINYAIIDGGSHQVRYYGQMQGMQIPFMDLIPVEAARAADAAPALQASQTDDRWTVCGSLCTTADVLARGVSFEGKSLGIGDVLVFHQAGAYSLYECMSLFLSRDLPSVYLLSEDGSLSCARGRVETNIFNRPEASR